MIRLIVLMILSRISSWIKSTLMVKPGWSLSLMIRKT